MTKAEKIAGFDPNGLATSDELYGMPFTPEECEVHILPVPWEVTVSYGSGAADGPEAIKEASMQVDLYDPMFPDGWQRGFHLKPISKELRAKSEIYREKAVEYLDGLAEGVTDEEALGAINAACAEMNLWVEDQVTQMLKEGKKVGLLGGDHSTPLGAYRALKKHHGSFGLLHIDAHADLREAYEGFTYSHASIMYNTLEENLVDSITSIGVRDYCHSEAELMENHPKVMAFTDHLLQKAQFDGHSWSVLVEQMIAELPEKVHISFDIDGLDPALCPSTGTPVPGGLSFAQAVYLIDEVVRSGRKIIGFDLVEVAPGPTEWDANVGGRLLYKLCQRLS